MVVNQVKFIDTVKSLADTKYQQCINKKIQNPGADANFHAAKITAISGLWKRKRKYFTHFTLLLHREGYWKGLENEILAGKKSAGYPIFLLELPLDAGHFSFLRRILSQKTPKKTPQIFAVIKYFAAVIAKTHAVIK